MYVKMSNFASNHKVAVERIKTVGTVAMTAAYVGGYFILLFEFLIFLIIDLRNGFHKQTKNVLISMEKTNCSLSAVQIIDQCSNKNIFRCNKILFLNKLQ